MRQAERTSTILAIAVTLLVPAVVHAQSAPDFAGRASTARAAALADVEANRSLVIRDTLDRWRSLFQPFDPLRNVGGEEERFTSALQGASTEKLLAASEAQTWEEFSAAVLGRWQGPSVIPLAPGAIPNSLGDAAADLVFTPVTPCRIIDTRIATGGSAGKIGPNTGKQFSVSLTDYTAQGGYAGSCGITIAPAAVAINVTSVSLQTGLGNLRVIQTGGGIPNVSLVNYTPGVNIANSAVVRSAGSVGSSNIYIYSGNSASDVVVDIMGYFAAPVATALDCVSVYNTTATTVAAGGEACASPPACAAGYTATAPLFDNDTFGGLVLSQANLYTSGFLVCGYNAGSGSKNFFAGQVCCRIPGR